MSDAFHGVVNRTARQSVPWWPPPNLPPEVRARISEDRHGPYAAYFYGSSPYQLQYRIGNWRSYGLPRPPARHDWYRTTDNHFALVNIASGTIAQLLAAR